MSDKNFKYPAASNNSPATALNHSNTNLQAKFGEISLKWDKETFTQKQQVNIYIPYEINLWPFTVGKDFASGN